MGTGGPRSPAEDPTLAPCLLGLRVALVHDWLTGMRGGERCLEDLCLLFPHADLYTLFHFPGSVSPLIERMAIHTARRFSWISRLPPARRRYRWFLPLFPRAVEGFDLRGYDLVVSLSHCVAKGGGEGQGVPRISYCFTPMRYIWDQALCYFNPDRFPHPLLPLIRASLARLRRWDLRAHPDRYLAISRAVAERIGRLYGREAGVIHPPVDLDRLPPPKGEPAGDYYLVVSALAPYKRIEDAIEAARLLGRRLVIVGTGEDDRRLRARAGPETVFRGWLEDAEIARLYRGARALLLPGEEDFGITPLESMASGRPVVALGRGGALETVVDLERAGDSAPTGVLYGEPGAEPLAEAMRKLERSQASFEPAALRAHAARFGRPRFRSEIRAALEAFMESRTSRIGPVQGTR
jgi:glycosyltransferase involved in cell wall biosynthesis